MKLSFFAAELAKNTGEMTLEGGEGGSGDETISKKPPLFRERCPRKCRDFFEEKME